MTNFIQKTHLDIGFSDFNCLLDSQCSLLTSQILGRCIKLKWSNRAYAVYWLCGTLLCPWDKDKAASKRIHVRGLSPAGEPESSEEEEIVQARRVRVQDHSPAGSPISEGEDDSTGSASSSSEESDSGKEFAGNMVQEIRMGRYGIMKTSERQ